MGNSDIVLFIVLLAILFVAVRKPLLVWFMRATKTHKVVELRFSNGRTMDIPAFDEDELRITVRQLSKFLHEAREENDKNLQDEIYRLVVANIGAAAYDKKLILTGFRVLSARGRVPTGIMP